MARADFYILNGSTTAARFTCSVAGKAWATGNTVFILTRDRDEAKRLDELLWTYQDISFLPHAQTGEEAGEVPVIIGWQGAEVPASDVIFNLTDEVPECISSFDRVVEIIPEDPDHRVRGRARYKQYRDMGFEMFNHSINLESDDDGR